jgi:hypothetical protein
MAAALMKNSTSKSVAQLFVQVFQGQALQCEGRFSLLNSRDVTIGKSANADLMIPFAPFPSDLRLFKGTKWGGKVLLDPRLDGFVSDGQRFGTVRDFIAPRGALKELATVLEPLEVDIPEGSRGALEISGYTIVFRVAKLKPAAVVQKIKGAPKAPFALPHGQTVFEKSGFLLGVLMTILVTVPAVVWMNKAPIQRFKDLSDLSPFMAAGVIHPDHFQILPWAFSTQFQHDRITNHVIRWVDDLRKKWDAEDAGQVFDSKIPVLNGFSVPKDIQEERRIWQGSLDSAWQSVRSVREKASPGSFLSGQNAYTPFSVIAAGGERGSISERVKLRLKRLDSTHEAAVTLLETEHIYMVDYFKEQSAEIKQIFDIPKEPGLFFRLAEKAFTDERANFHLAESFAALARKNQSKLLAESSSDENHEAEQPFVWSGESLVLAGGLNMPSLALDMAGGSEEQLFKNASLALGKIAPPPPPKPVPVINMNEVEAFVRSRSPEIKGCYDVALNRNPRLGGMILWKWTIGLNGRVMRSLVDRSEVKDNSFIGCLQRKIAAWTFPKPLNGTITITFPFRFVVRENLDTLDRITR